LILRSPIDVRPTRSRHFVPFSQAVLCHTDLFSSFSLVLDYQHSSLSDSISRSWFSSLSIHLFIQTDQNSSLFADYTLPLRCKSICLSSRLITVWYRPIWFDNISVRRWWLAFAADPQNVDWQEQLIFADSRVVTEGCEKLSNIWDHTEQINEKRSSVYTMFPTIVIEREKSM
jgi:hypothetical protein